MNKLEIWNKNCYSSEIWQNFRRINNRNQLHIAEWLKLRENILLSFNARFYTDYAEECIIFEYEEDMIRFLMEYS